MEIIADEFIYLKKNILEAVGTVRVFDLNKNLEIYADKIVYEKNQQIITANKKVKAFDLNKNLEIYADKIVYEKNQQIITANKKVKAFDLNKNLEIYADKIVYEKNQQIITANKKVKAFDLNKNLEIYADKIVYEKNQQIITANKKVKAFDLNKNLEIYADKIVYEKNQQIITANNNAKAIFEKNKKVTANKFEYNVTKNILNAKEKVKAIDEINNNVVLADELTYFDFSKKIISRGKTFAKIKEDFAIDGKNLIYELEQNQITSNYKTKINDNKNNQVYLLEKFNFSINEEILKAENLFIITNYNLPKSDKFFSDAIIDLKNQKFSGRDAEINIHKNIFDNSTNDPRIKAVSAKGNKEKTKLNKAIFTSCNKNQKCPAWSIKADKIEHDKERKQITYKNAILNIYDVPVLYFPKFFHPDPSVKRQSGLLKPEFNNSNILGSSITLPYFNAISGKKDLTFKPTLFDNNTKIAQLEYRQANKYSSFITDIGFVNNFKSNTTKDSKNLSHFFGKFNLDLNFEDFNTSSLMGRLRKYPVINI